MNFWSNLGTFEKRMVTGGAILLLLALFYLQYDGKFFGDDESSKPEIGVLASAQNDTRYRNSQNLVWAKAENERKIHLGDAIFTGAASKAQVNLKSGGAVSIDENSLVVFNDFDKETMPNLMNGNFKIHVDGNAKFALNGEVVTLAGKNSDLQITLDKDKKPVFKTLKGSVDVVSKAGGTKHVEEERPRIPAAQPTPEPVAPAPTEMPVPQVSEKDKVIPYTWRLSDLYDQKESEISNRVPPANMVNRAVTLDWEFPSKAQNKTILEFGDDPGMQSATRFESSNGTMSFTSLALGDHYWRVSPDGERWSDLQKFTLDPRFLENAAPKIGATLTDLALISSSVHISMTLVAPIEASGFVGEVSSNRAFDTASTSVFWSPTNRVISTLTHEGSYFYRFRTVNKSQELSDWSPPKQFTVVKPGALPGAPKLAKNEALEGYVGDHFPVQFEAGPNSRSHLIQVKDKDGKVVAETNGLTMDWIPLEPGQYTAQAVSRDVYGRPSPASATIPMRVHLKPPPVASQPASKKADRAPSDVGSNSMKLDKVKEPHLNDRYDSSEVAIEASMFSLQSNVQQYGGYGNPVSTQLGVRVHHWFGDYGVEGAFKEGVFAVKSTGAGGSPQDVEVRFHRRWEVGFPFDLARSLQITAFGGYEMYQNAGNSVFSSHYNLLKFGSYMRFPVWNRWDAGGEFVGGYGTDGSQMEEISGHFGYYLDTATTLGFGYRIHLFKAGSTSSTPDGLLPYREGYTEGYTALIYHY